MIAIERPPEPAGLRAVRKLRLTAAREARELGQRVKFEEYDVVKPQLFVMQYNKCAYCEKREEQAKYRDVDHYRPKALYWWLAWTWENLLFACIDCNREYKASQFPLVSEVERIVGERSAPAAEEPLVIDPSDPGCDATAEIVFRRERVQGKERWKPYGLSRRGVATIRVCGLDRPSLLTLYTAHVMSVVRPKLEAFFQAHKSEDTRAAFAAWERAKRGLLGKHSEFRALSHDALEVLVSEPLRRRYQLELARPGM